MDPWTHGPMPCHSRARPSGAHGGPNYYESGGATFFCWGWEGAGSSMSGKLKGDFIFKHGPHGPSIFGCPNLDPHIPTPV